MNIFINGLLFLVSFLLIPQVYSQPIKVGGIIDQDHPPFLWKDICGDNQPLGYIPDTLSKVLQDSGYSLTFLPLVPIKELAATKPVKQLRNGQIDMMLSAKWDAGPDIRYSEVPIVANNMIVVFRSQGEKTITGLSDLIGMKGMAPNLLANAPAYWQWQRKGLNAQFYVDLKEAMAAFREKRIDFLISPRYSSFHRELERGEAGVTHLSLPQFSMELYLMTRSDFLSAEAMAKVDKQLAIYQKPKRHTFLVQSYLKKWVAWKTCVKADEEKS